MRTFHIALSATLLMLLYPSSADAQTAADRMRDASKLQIPEPKPAGPTMERQQGPVRHTPPPSSMERRTNPASDLPHPSEPGYPRTPQPVRR